VEDGTVGAWGVSGQRPESSCVFDAFRASAEVLQVRHDVLDESLEALGAYRQLLTYGTFSRVLPEISGRAQTDHSLCQRWSRTLGLEVTNEDAVAALLLRYALFANGDGMVIIGTGQPHRVSAAASIAMEEPAEDASQFAALAQVASEMRSPYVSK
jgi:hypothetical protein